MNTVAFQGFLALGGTEIANATRTKAYVDEVVPLLGLSDCWDCADLAEVLGHDTYQSPIVDRPDWLSDSDPDSWDFCGFYPLEVEGLDDGTREATVTELALDGAVVGAPRYRSREIRVTGLLIGATDAAVTYGLRWLAKALEGSPCREGQGCTGDHLCYYAACPPMCTDSPALDEWPVDGEDDSERNHESQFYLCDGGLIETAARACSVEYERTLYQVTTTSGPTVVERYNSACGSMVRVEFTMVAGVPFAFSTAVSAVPGLEPVPDPQIAPEVACTPGSDVVVRTNMATNPVPIGNAADADTGTGWLADGDVFDVAVDESITRLEGGASVRVQRNTVTESENLAPNPDPAEDLDGWSWRLGQSSVGPDRVNLVENPWPRADDGRWVYEVPAGGPGTITATNLQKNPRYIGVDGKLGGGSAAWDQDDIPANGPDGGGYTRITVTADATGTAEIGTDDGAYSAVTVGETYTGSFYHRQSAPGGTQIVLSWRDADGVQIDRTFGTALEPATGEWVRHDVSGVAPDGAETMAVRWYVPETVAPAGATLDVACRMITAGNTLIDYFDGDYATSDTHAYSWSGEVNASPSIEQALDAPAYSAPLDIVTGDGLVRTNLAPDPRLTDRPWGRNGSTGTQTHVTTGGPNGHGYFEYLLDTSPTTSPMSVALSNGGINGIPAEEGQTYTVSGWWYQSNNVNGTQRFDVAYYDAAGTAIGNAGPGDDIDIPGSGQWFRASRTITTPAGTAFIRPSMIWSGTTYQPGDALRVADALVEEGATVGSYFDGDTADTAEVTYEWTGEANASSSTATTVAEVVAGPDGEPGFARHTQGISNEDSQWSITYTGDEALTDGAVHTVSVYVRSTTERQVDFAGRTFDLPGYGWVRLTNQVTGTGESLTLTISGIGQDAGAVVDVARALVEESTALDDYFDGSTPDRDGYTFTWTGTADASTSTSTLLPVEVTTELVADGVGPGEQTTFQRTTIVAPKAGGEDGASYVMATGGGEYTVDLQVRTSVAIDVVLRVTALDAGGQVLRTQNGTLLALRADEWTALGPVRILAPEATDRLQVAALMPGGEILPADATFDAAAVRVVEGLYVTDPMIGRVTFVGQHDDQATTIAVDPGGTYTASLYVGANVDALATMSIAFYDAEASPVADPQRGLGLEVEAWAFPVGVTEWHRPWVTATAPAGAASMVVNVSVRKTTSGADLSDAAWLTSALIEQTSDVLSYFDGSFPDSRDMSYEWTGTAHTSTSNALLAIPAEPSPIQDPDCPVIPAPPRPPVIDISCVETPDQWRRYVVEVEADLVPEWRDAVPIIRLQTGPTEVRQVRVRFYPNPLMAPLEALNPCDYCGEFVVTYIPPRSLMLIDGIRQWATVTDNRSGDTVTANHLLASSDGGPVSWPVLGCGVGYTLVVDVSPIAVADLTPQICLAARS